MSGKHPRRLTATDLAKLGSCEAMMFLDEHFGERISPQRAAGRARGNREHQRMHIDVSANHDRRCFIASAVYGEDDPRTQLLRQYRDDRLLTHRKGRWLVASYYRLSPPIAALATRFAIVSRVARVILTPVIAWLGRSQIARHD